MSHNRIAFVPKAFFFIFSFLSLHSCETEELDNLSDSSSIVGKWEQVNGCSNSSGATNYFDFNFTYGTVGQIDCDSRCSGGGVYTSFNYTVSGGSVRIEPTRVSQYCGVQATVPPAFDATFSISGNILTLDGQQFRRTSSSGGSGSGGNTGGSSQKGKIAFYTKKNNGCSAINITVDGSITKNLSYYHPEGITDCTKGAVFDLEKGSHSFTATCNSISWSGSFNITPNGCLIYHLQ